jgi:hypothetical protein
VEIEERTKITSRPAMSETWTKSVEALNGNPNCEQGIEARTGAQEHCTEKRSHGRRSGTGCPRPDRRAQAAGGKAKYPVDESQGEKTEAGGKARAPTDSDAHIATRSKRQQKIVQRKLKPN